jgi:4-amino-4-deoxy-L-arabinose transferase-like glycosyltransferase
MDQIDHTMLESSGLGPRSRRLAVLRESRVAHLLLLTIPFVAVIAGWHGLSDAFGTYQAFDELVHSAIVNTDLGRWPQPVLGGYGSWSGPFVYWLLATLALPLGGSLTAVRLVVAAFSWGTIAITYVLLRDRLGARPADALSLSLVLAICPFFFGESFLVLTDNPTWFFVVLGLERLLAFVRRPHLWRYAGFAACLAAASTMRQVTVWLLAPALIAVFGVRIPRHRLAGVLALTVAALLPLVALVVLWGGLLPGTPDAAAASVGAEFDLRVRNLLLSLAIVGLYALLMIPWGEAVAWVRPQSRLVPVVGASLALVAAIVLIAAGALGSVGGDDRYGMGLVAQVSALYPGIAGASVLWWLLVPLGAAATAALTLTRWSALPDRLLVAALLGVLVSAVANPTWYQRYVDFPILLILAALAVTAGVRLGRVDRLRWLFAGLLGVAWLLYFAVMVRPWG